MLLAHASIDLLKWLLTDECRFRESAENWTRAVGILDAEKMKKCVWVRPELVAVVEFMEWTEGDRFRDSKFSARRDDEIGARLSRSLRV